MMHIQYDAEGEIVAENGKIHYRGEKTGLLIVDEGISYLDLLSLVKRACGTETEGPLLLVRARSDDAKGFRALLHNSPASMASPPPRATGTGTPLVLKYEPTNFQKEEYLPTYDTTASTVAGMASLVTTTSHLQLSEFRASENHKAVPTSSGTPSLLINSTEISSISLPLDLQPVVLELETSENHQSIPTSSGTPLLLMRNDDASDAILKELNEKQAKIQKPKLVDMEWISSLAKFLMERDLPCEELDIMEQIISDQYGYDVDFKVVWKSRSLAIKEMGILEDNEEIVKKLKKKEEKKPILVDSIDSIDSSGTPMLLRNDNASDAMKVLNEKQVKIQKPKLVDKEWISSLAMSLMERDLPCEELNVMEQIRDQYGYDVDFKVVWKSRILAIKKLGLLEDNEKIVKKLNKKKKGEKPMVVPSIDRRKDDASVEVVKELKEITEASRYIFMTKKPKLVDMEWISNLAKSLMQRALPCTEKYIVDVITKEFGYEVDFNFAWKSRNLALKQLGLLKDDDNVKFDWEENQMKKVGKRVPDIFDDDELDIDEFVDESDDEFDAYGEIDDDQERKKKENTKVVQAGYSGKKVGYLDDEIVDDQERKKKENTKVVQAGHSEKKGGYRAGEYDKSGKTQNNVRSSNLRNGLNQPPQSFHEPEKAVSGSSSSDISRLQKRLCEIRDFLEGFRRIIMILLIVILLFLLLHHQTGKR